MYNQVYGKSSQSVTSWNVVKPTRAGGLPP
jgi:hypothetical protein